MPRSLRDLVSQAGGWAQAPVVGALSPNRWTNREPQMPGNINRNEASRRSSSQHQDPALSNCLQTPVLDVSGQTTSKTVIQHHPSKRGKKNETTKRHVADEGANEVSKNLQDQINEDEIGNLPEKEFRVMIVKMIQNLRNSMEKIQETFNKNLEELKSKQTVMNNTITEIKNILEGINSRITEAGERITELEDKMVEITAREQNKEKRMKRIQDSLRDLWDNIKCTNIRIIGDPEEEKKKKGAEKIFEEIIVKNFPNMGKEIVNQVQEAQRVPYRINPKRNTPRHVLI